MSNYQNSDYALNKYSDGIVYRFADGIVEITFADYLAENPDKTEADFLALKKFSDSNYYEDDRANYRQTWKDMPFADTDETLFNAEISAEGSYFGDIEAYEEDGRYQEKVESMLNALDKLTEVQRRRYLQYYIQGLSAREIAKQEGTNHKSVLESLNGAEKKIKKVLAKG